MKKTKKRSVAAKILISCLIVALVIGLSYLAYYLINYTFYDDYKDAFLPITYAEGSEFKALSDSSRPEELAEGYVLAAESKALKLYYNETTTEVAVYDITKDKITYSNPQNINESDYDNALYLNKMNSQLVVYYYPTDSANAIAEMNSYEYCVNMKPKEGQETVEKQFKVEAIPNGIRILYTIGDLSSETGTIATYISKDTFDDIIKKLEDYDIQPRFEPGADGADGKAHRSVRKIRKSRTKVRDFFTAFVVWGGGVWSDPPAVRSQ